MIGQFDLAHVVRQVIDRDERRWQAEIDAVLRTESRRHDRRLVIDEWQVCRFMAIVVGQHRLLPLAGPRVAVVVGRPDAALLPPPDAGDSQRTDAEQNESQLVHPCLPQFAARRIASSTSTATRRETPGSVIVTPRS